jgi:hypothetical protein
VDIPLIPSINILGRFCGVRDVGALTGTELGKKYGFAAADVMVLFGGSIICGGDELARAMKENIARHYVIVGGAGHTTQTLRDKMRALYPRWDTAGLAEADLFNGYLQRRYGFGVGLLERRSTNCGNNITFLLELLKRENICPRSMILMQDATMQRRMAAGLRKYRPKLTVVNYASYSVSVVCRENKAAYDREPLGMWDIERYCTLLMGEIPRLRDSESGYGPKGKDYIAHEDLPGEVLRAYETIRGYDASLIRAANDEFASPAD